MLSESVRSCFALSRGPVRGRSPRKAAPSGPPRSRSPRACRDGTGEKRKAEGTCALHCRDPLEHPKAKADVKELNPHMSISTVVPTACGSRGSWVRTGPARDVAG